MKSLHLVHQKLSVRFRLVHGKCSVSFRLVHRKLSTRQRAQGHRTYEVGITKCEVKFVLNLEALDLLDSDELKKDVLGMKVCQISSLQL